MKSAPGADGTIDGHRDDLALRPIAAACWQGIIFVNADRDARPFHTTYYSLAPLAAKTGLNLTDYTHHSRVDLDMSCDWKHLYNTAECYHCPTIHPSSLNRMYASEGFYAGGWQDGVRYARAQLTDDRRLQHSVQLFPGMLLFTDPVVGLLGRISPVGVGRSRFSVDYFAAPGADASEVEEFVGSWTQTLREDQVLLAKQAIGVASGAIDRGRP